MRKRSELRIGVYVCWCGGNISDVVDVEKVVEAVKKEPGVAVARHFMFMCSEAGQKMIEDDVKKYKLDAVVVASCSPRLHELTFRNAVMRAGLNPYMYYHANIREQASWPHENDPEEATRKAIRHVRMAVAYLRHASPLEKIKVNATPSVLIIGGGIAGLRAALDLSDMGVNVYLVEKQPFLGGHLLRLGEIYPYGRDGWRIVHSLVEELVKRDNVAIYTNAEVLSVKGYIGNFEVSIRVRPRVFTKKCDRIDDAINLCPIKVPDEYSYGVGTRTAIIKPPPGAYPDIPAIDLDNCTKCMKCLDICRDSLDFDEQPYIITLKVGSIITATGFKPYEPRKGEYGYKIYSEVLTLPQFLQVLKQQGNGKLIINGREVKSIAFIYCVGSRELPTRDREVHTYCSRYCCNATMYTALRVFEKYPNILQYHLYRDIRTYGKHELMYEEVSRRGALFIKYDASEPPKVLREDGRLLVRVRDLLTDREELEIPVDLVVLVTGMEPNTDKRLTEILKLPVGRDGFYQEVHPKLKPVETSLAGYLIAGTAQGPKDTRETVLSASAAAAKAAGIVLRGLLELEPFVAFVDPEKCELSRKCMEECPYDAIEIKEYRGIGKRAWVNAALCKGCGSCVAVCPTGAIQIRGLTNKQVEDMIEAAGRGV